MPAPEPDFEAEDDPAVPPRAAVIGTYRDAVVPVVLRAGLHVTDDLASADAIIWCSPDPTGLSEALEAAKGARWVQLPYAGIERFVGFMTPERIFTCAKGIYGPAVAEMALTLLLTVFRRIDRYVGASAWEGLPQQSLAGSHVVILGGGGIGRSLVAMLQPLDARVTVVRRSGEPIDGASVVDGGVLESGPARQDLLGSADAVVLALPLTPETSALVDLAFLQEMKPSAWLVNVARGRIVVTDDLVKALDERTIAGACLDVTDPEPLTTGHRLWRLSNCIVTPHVANTPELGGASLLAQVEENCRRFAAGETLDGIVDQAGGY
ncbi:MAG: NAD(P)-dependent oxidoreductase [Acidimicrobiales bacterium]